MVLNDPTIGLQLQPKISLFSKYERQKDRRTFTERRLIYQDPEDAKAKVRWHYIEKQNYYDVFFYRDQQDRG